MRKVIIDRSEFCICESSHSFDEKPSSKNVHMQRATMNIRWRSAVELATVGWALFLLPRHADTFSVMPSTARPGVRTTIAVAASQETAPTTTTPDKEPTKEEKLTKEAEELLDVLNNPKNSLLVAQVAPSVRIAIPEEFGLEPGSLEPGQLVAALKELGFDLVLDTNTAAGTFKE